MRKLLAVAAGSVVVGGLLGMQATANAAPPKSPYPDVSRYAKLDFEGFKVAGDDNVWFSTPFGLRCGIWASGAFGCTGAIPGSPGGTNQVGWFPGDASAHFDNTDQPRFLAPGGVAQRVLPRENYIEFGGATCATTDNDSVYCFNGTTATSYNPDQFLVGRGVSFLGSAPTS